VTDAPQGIPLEDYALAAPVEDVEALMHTMSKALRAFHMYLENNPVFQRFQVALREAFETVWEQSAGFDIRVTEDGFKYGDRTFTVGEGRDSLDFAFYKDGIRHLTFLPGFEEEVAEFLDAVHRAMRNEADADDLITVLWEKDFTCLQYGYVDLLMEGVEIPDAPMQEPEPLEDGVFTLELVDEMEEDEGEEGAPGGLKAGLSYEDFDGTLYFLDDSEMAAIRAEIDVEMERNLRTDVLNALFDRLEEDSGLERHEEILDILDELLPLFLSGGILGHAAHILEELDDLLAEHSSLHDDTRRRVEQLFERLSEPDVLEQFVQALEDGAVAPDSDDVNLFFSRLRPHAMPILIRFSEMSETSGVRGRLASAIDGLAARYPAEVNALLASEETVLVAGAAKVAGRVRLAEAVPGLEQALEHPDHAVRLAVVDSLVAIRRAPALQALTVALEDPTRDVRIAAASALGRLRFANARDALEAVIDGKRIKDADLTEKMAYFEAYGAVGGTKAVERLDALLNAKGFLGRRRSPTELRACAALGLGQAGTPEAREALEKARTDDDPIVRNAVIRAMNQELVTQ
jgi:HEAT repeat protein